MRRPLLLVLGMVVFATPKLRAQENPSLNTYIFNPIVLAPSFSGMYSGTFSFLTDYRYLGIEGAPRSSITSFDYKLVDLNLGLSAAIISDEIGPVKSNSFSLSTAYHLQISRAEYFSFGMKHGFHNFNMNLNNEKFIDLADISINTAVYNTFYYNLDLSGMYYNEESYAGISLLNVVKGQFLIDNYTSRSICFYGGSETQFSPTLKIAYSGMLVVEQGSPNVINLYGQYFITPELRVGLHKHSNDYGFNAFFESRGFRIFYKYSYPANSMRYFSKQSHTIGLSVDFINEKSKIETPVFFLN